MRRCYSQGVIPLWLKIAWTAWVVVWAPLYAWHYGPPNFLWFCDIGNFVLALALWTESRTLFSWQAVSLLVVQSAWVIDLIVRLLAGVHPFGATKYMFDPAIPLGVRLASLFHAAVPVLLVWAVRRLRYDPAGFWLQCVATVIVLPVSLLFGPARDINWVYGPFDVPQSVIAPPLYFALCLVGYPVLLYLPTHLALRRFERAA